MSTPYMRHQVNLNATMLQHHNERLASHKPILMKQESHDHIFLSMAGSF